MLTAVGCHNESSTNNSKTSPKKPAKADQTKKSSPKFVIHGDDTGQSNILDGRIIYEQRREYKSQSEAEAAAKFFREKSQVKSSDDYNIETANEEVSLDVKEVLKLTKELLESYVNKSFDALEQNPELSEKENGQDAEKQGVFQTEWPDEPYKWKGIRKE